MSSFLSTTITPLQQFLFSADDTLTFGPGLNGNNVSVTTDGVTTTLSAVGLSLALPSASFSQASESGHVTFLDGTHLLSGTTAGDTLSGTSGDDVMYGGDGNDRMAAGSGNDYVYGGAGSDTIDGGDGNDHLYGYGFGPGASIDGADSISGGAGGDYIQGNAGDDTLDGGDGNDRIYGGADNDHITGGAGNDSVNGNFGDDVIDGGAGDDSLRGGKGCDVITGGDGNDQIYGDLGADTLTGGAGADVFHFSGSDAAIVDTDTLLGHIDTITDFTDGQDHIALGFAPTAVVHGAFAGTVAQALTYAQQLLDGQSSSSEVAAVQVGNDTLLFYGNSGGHIADSVIDLQNVTGTSIGTSDFI